MKTEYKYGFVILILVSVAIIYIELFKSKNNLVTPKLSDRTKIINTGNPDDIREYLRRPGAFVTIDNYYSIIDRNRPDIMEILLGEFNLDPDLSFKYELSTPLLHAARTLRPEIVSILIKYGASVNYQDPYGITPLIAAAYTVHKFEKRLSLKVTQLLVEAGADINVISKYGKTAIEGALFSDDLVRVKYLVENGGDIHHLNPSGANYMFYCDELECFEYFLSQDFDINSTDSDGRNIFQAVHYLGTPLNTTKQLLDWGADICHLDDSGDSVLNYVERQRAGIHDQTERPEYYKRLVDQNRKSETYQYLSEAYHSKCTE